MTEEKTTTVEMTAEELEQLKEFRKQKETEAAEKKLKAIDKQRKSNEI